MLRNRPAHSSEHARNSSITLYCPGDAVSRARAMVDRQRTPISRSGRVNSPTCATCMPYSERRSQFLMLPACWRRVEHCQVQTSIDSVVSIAICQRRRRQRFRSARASLVRKIISSSGWIATTKSSPSHLIATCRRYSMGHPLLRNYFTPLPQANHHPTTSFTVAFPACTADADRKGGFGGNSKALRERHFPLSRVPRLLQYRR